VRVPVRVHRDDVERAPVDILLQHGGVGHIAAEPLVGGGGGLGEESVHAGWELAQAGPQLGVAGGDRRDPRVGVLAWDEPGGEQAQLAPGDQHDPGPLVAQVFGPLGAVGKVRQHLVRRHLARKRREPHLQSRLGRMPGSQRQALRVTPSDPDRGAMQILSDDLQLPPDHVGVEGFP